jgi:polysaccharide export outer membrane protein
MMRIFPLVLTAAALASCSNTVRTEAGMTAATSMNLQDATHTADAASDYRIGALDQLSVTVFQVEDLSFEKLTVGATGLIEMPLIGTVQAAGLTPRELAGDIQQRLGVNYLQNPRVTVTVTEAASQKVTVDGAVTEPGVFQMKGRTTLVQAVAMAKGATRVADLRSVAVFRQVDGQRMVAVFDLAAIRAGRAVDPVLQGDDVVLVDTSRTSVAMREVLAALPGLAIFRPY